MKIFSILDWQFWWYAAVYIVAVLVSIYIPGQMIVHLTASRGLKKQKKLSNLVTVCLAFGMGLALWALQGYVFGYLRWRWLTFGYLLFSVVWWLVVYKNKLMDLLQDGIQILFKKYLPTIDKWSLVLLFAGVASQYIAVIASGFKYKDGVCFFFLNAWDGVLHLAFIESMMRWFPPLEPGAYPLPLTNYHYFADLVVSELVRVWQLPTVHTYFQYSTLMVSLLLGVATYAVVINWGGTKRIARWALFFLYFSGNATYIFTLLLHQNFGFEVTPVIESGPNQLVNMPQAFAKLIFIVGMISFHYWIKKKQFKWGIFTALLWGTVIGFKVYFGILIAVGFILMFSFLFLQNVWQKKGKLSQSELVNHLKNGAVILLFAGVSGIIFFPNNFNSGGLFWAPLAWPKLLIAPEKMNFRDWWLRRQVYQQAGNIRNLLILDAIAAVITLIGILGSRLIGFIPTPNFTKKLGIPQTVFYLGSTVVMIFLAMNTLQISGEYNVFNFFIVALLPLTFFSAFVVDYLWHKGTLFKGLVLIIVILNLPRAVHEFTTYLIQYYKGESREVISYQELEALMYIRQQTPINAIIQSHPTNRQDRETPYIAAFTQRNTYLTGTGMLESHNQPVTDRYDLLDVVVLATDGAHLAKNLKKLNIDYLYLQKNRPRSLLFDLDSTKSAQLNIVFENDQVVIIEPD